MGDSIKYERKERKKVEKLLFGSLNTKGRGKDKLGSSLRKSLYKDRR